MTRIRRRRMAAALALFCAALPTFVMADGVVLVTVVNNTTHRVVVAQCDVTCRETHDQATLDPGQSWLVNASDENLDEYIEVIDTTQPRPACMDLKYPQPQPTATVYVSTAVAGTCPTGAISTSFTDGIWLAAYVGSALVVVVFCVVGGVHAFYRLRRRGWHDVPGFIVATLAGLGLFMGGWLGYLPYLVVRWMQKKLRRRPPIVPLPPTTPNAPAVGT